MSLYLDPATYTNSASTYNADTATQSPSLANDLAINAAIQHALRLEGYTGDPYPMVDLGSKKPYSFARNKNQFLKDQAALEEMTGGQFGGETMMYPESAATNINPNPGTAEAEPADPGVEGLTPVSGVTEPEGGRGRPGFDEPERMQRRGERKEARGREMLEGARGEARKRAKEVIRKGRDMAKQGRIAEAFRDIGAERDELKAEGQGVGRQNRILDRRFGNALRSFGVDTANQIAETYGAERYTDSSEEMSDAQRQSEIAKIQERIDSRDKKREEAGGKRYKEITGTSEKAEQRRSAAKRARQFSRKIKRQIGRVSRKYGAEDAAQIAEAVGIMR